MSNNIKVEQVSQIEHIYKNSSSVIITHYHGLTVSDITNLRRSLRESGAGLKVVKNTLSKIAAKNAGFDMADELFAGPTALAYSSDPVSAAKIVMKFKKANDNLKVIGGILDNKILKLNEVERLSQLPSLDELRGKLVGLLNAPATKLVRVINTPAGNLARVTKAYAEK